MRKKFTSAWGAAEKITEEEYEAYEGLCEECHEIEIDELDYEDDDY
jgi:hypothetical protein